MLDQSIKTGSKVSLRAKKEKLVGHKVSSCTICRIYIGLLYKAIRLISVTYNENCFDLEEVEKAVVAHNTTIWNNTTAQCPKTGIQRPKAPLTGFATHQTY